MSDTKDSSGTERYSGLGWGADYMQQLGGLGQIRYFEVASEAISGPNQSLDWYSHHTFAARQEHAR